MTRSLETLNKSLLDFAKKYYTIKFIKNLLIRLSFIGIYWFTLFLINYKFYLTVKTKKVLFFITIIFTLYLLIDLIITYLYPLFSVKKTKSYINIAKLLNQYDKTYKDFIINIYQLKYDNDKNSEIIKASIDQKIKSLKSLDFKHLIPTKQVYKYFSYFILIFFTITASYILKPAIFTEGGKKLLNYNTFYKPPLPYEVILMTNTNKALYGKDYTIKIKVIPKNSEFPENVYIKINNNTFLMNKDTNQIYSYTIKNLTYNVKFSFIINNFQYGTYELKIIPLPQILDFSIKVIPPAYTGLKEKVYRNVTTLKINQGSYIIVNIISKNLDSLTILNADEIIKKVGDNRFMFKHKIFEPEILKIITIKGLDTINLLNLNIKVLKDEYPKINVSPKQDSLNLNLVHFSGSIEDDFGFTKLIFTYIVNDTAFQIKVPINKNLKQQSFIYDYNFNHLNNSSIKYYFEIFDNDLVNGPKSTKSQIYFFFKPTQKDIAFNIDSTEQFISNNFTKSKDLINDIKSDIEHIQKMLLDKNLTTWEKKSYINMLKQKQEELQKLLNQNLNANQKITSQLSSFTKSNKDLIEKWKQLEQLQNELLNDKIKELIKEIEDLIKSNNNTDLNKKLEELNKEMEYYNKNLELNLELFKRLSIEQNIQQESAALKELAKQQENINKQLKRNNLDSLKKAQKQLNQDFDKIYDLYKETVKQNKQLQNPINLQTFEQEFNKIQEQMNNALNDLNSKKINKAKRTQNNISQNLNQLSDKLMSSLMNAAQSQQMEDLNELTRILNDIIYLSFAYETLYSKNTTTFSASSAFITLETQARLLEYQFIPLQDSLYSLASRNPQITKPISDYLRNINSEQTNLKQALQLRKKSFALQSERKIIMDLNNLAILLQDIIKQIEKSMQNASVSSNNKSSNKQTFKTLQQLQNQLEQELKNLLDQIKQGKSTNNSKMIKAVETTERIKMLIDNYEQENQLSPKTQQLLNEIKKDLQKNYQDIIYNNITDATIKRTQKIRVKLLDAENSTNEQKQDNKRISETAANLNNNKNTSKINSKTRNSIEKELLLHKLIILQSNYKNSYLLYINKINTQNEKSY